MWPVLKRGDLVLVKAVKTKEELAVGDIVVFKNLQGFTIHRITEINEKNIVTKGDANNVSDNPVQFTDILGKTLEYKNGKPVRIPKLGNLSIWLNKKKESNS